MKINPLQAFVGVLLWGGGKGHYLDTCDSGCRATVCMPCGFTTDYRCVENAGIAPNCTDTDIENREPGCEEMIKRSCYSEHWNICGQPPVDNATRLCITSNHTDYIPNSADQLIPGKFTTALAAAALGTAGAICAGASL